MAQLTWRNIDAPDFGSAIRALSDSNNQLQRAFSGVGQAFTDYGVRRQNENTGNIELALSKYGTNADLQAAIQQGLLDPNALREQYGNFNAADIAKYQNALANDLQTREVNQQAIDQTNNLNQFGGQITDALVRARQNDRSGIDALSANPNVLGSVLAKYSQDIASNLGAAGQDAETRRSHLADEANAAANTAIARTNANLRQQEFDAGAKARLVQNMQYDQVLNNREAVQDGAKALASLGATPMAKFKQDEVARLQKEGKSNDYIKNYLGGLDNAYTLSTTGSPEAVAAKASLEASVTPQVAGNTKAALDSLNTGFDSNGQVFSAARAAAEDETDYKGNVETATDKILSFAKDSDRDDVRNYLKAGQEQGIPLKELVAAARGTTQSTAWGWTKSVLPFVQDDSAKIDRSAAYSLAQELQNKVGSQEIAGKMTELNIQKQQVASAQAAVEAAAANYQDIVSRPGLGADSDAGRAAWAMVQRAMEAQQSLVNSFRKANTKDNPPAKRITEQVTAEELRRRAIEARQAK